MSIYYIILYILKNIINVFVLKFKKYRGNMAVKNGNYEFFDIDTIKPNLIESFCCVLGEDSRKHVTNTINQIFFRHTYSFDYVNDEYLKHIKKYKEDILKKFYQKTGLKRTDAIDNYFDFDCLTSNALNEIIYFNDNEENTLKKELVVDNDVLDFCVNFGINTDLESEEIRQKAISFYKNFLYAVMEVENEHPCNVFADVSRYNYNLIEDTQKFIYELKNKGFDISEKDIEKLKNPYFELCDFTNLDCYGKYFYLDYNTPGLFKAFSSENQKNIKSRFFTNTIYFVVDCLKFLILEGCKLRFVDKETILNFNYLNKEEKSSLTDLLYKEFEYQKVYNKKHFPNPKDVDDMLVFIENLQDKATRKCSFSIGRHMTNVGDNSVGLKIYASNHCGMDKNIFTPQYNVVNFEDPDYASNKSILSNIIHEVGHCLGFDNLEKINDDTYLRQYGITTTKFKADENGFIQGDIDDRYENWCAEEYCNQRLEKEVLEEYIRLYGIPQFQEIEGEEWGYGLYDYYGFVMKDFYNEFSEEIKETKKQGYSIFARRDYPEDTLSYIKYKLGSKLGHILKTPLDGAVDFANYIKLSELVERLNKLIEKEGLCKPELRPDDFNDLDKMSIYLSEKGLNELINIKKEKDKIMKIILKDRNRYKKEKNEFNQMG